MIALGDVDLSVVVVPMRWTFRRVNWREAVLIHGPAGWGEFSPFSEYPPEVTARWLAAALEWACVPFDKGDTDGVDANVTIPAVDPDAAHRLVAQSGASTAKVKVADPGHTPAADLDRVAAVRDALGPDGALRIDVNGAWSVDEAVERIAEFNRYRLEYVEQPVASIPEMAELRRRIDVPVAADESVRRSIDPMQVVEANAADILIIKVQPIGGVRRALDLADRSGLPVVVSSALETSVGLSQGVAAAAMLDERQGERRAHGLGTASLLAGDVVRQPLIAHDGVVSTRRPEPDPDLLEAWKADRSVEAAALQRLRAAAEFLT